MLGLPLREVFAHERVMAWDDQRWLGGEAIKYIKPIQHVLQIHNNGEGFAGLEIFLVVGRV